MSTLTEFLTSKEVYMVILIAISICVTGTIYFVIEKIYHSKKAKKIDFSKEDKIIKIEDNRVVVESADKVEPIKEEKEKLNEVPLIIPKEEVLAQPIIEEPVEEKKEEVKSIKDDNRLVIPIEEFEEKKSIENILEEVTKEVETKKEEELVYTEIEPNQEEAKEEIRKATEELLKTQELQKLDAIDLSKFEEEQEENAIISIDELYSKSKVIHNQEEVMQYEDEGDEPISLADLEARMNKIKADVSELEKEEEKQEPIKVEEVKQTVKLDDFNTIDINNAYNDDKVFKSSPIISPIFGIEKNVSTNDMELENTANYEKLDDEIKKTNEFLKVLKELQKKLE